MKVWVLLAALFIGGACCVAVLPILKRLKARQEILSYVAEHKGKAGTPTMGGAAFMAAAGICCLLMLGQNNSLALLAFLVSLAYCFVGLLDDVIKLKYKRNEGLMAYQKILVQLLVAVIVALFVYHNPYVGSKMVIPFTQKEIDLGWWSVPLIIFVFLAVTNGVNLTDGLDGLASSVTVCYLGVTVILITFFRQNALAMGETLTAAEYDGMITLLLIYIGALAAFMLFNCNPAYMFMGDTGSMALGGIVACGSIFTKMTLFIPIIGIAFVLSCVSVLLQVGYFKATKGKRLFLMSPYHHHLQKKGLSEWRIGVIYCLATLIAGGVVLLFYGGV